MSEDVAEDEDGSNLFLQLREQLPEQHEAVQQLHALLEIDPDNEEAQQTLAALQASIEATESALRDAGYEVGVTTAAATFGEDAEESDGTEGQPDSDGSCEQVDTMDDVAYGQLSMALAHDSALVSAAAASGPQGPAVNFADWEGHTRGIGSKLMAQMGYQAGRGLGVRQQGPVAPLEVVVGQAKAGLGMGKEGKTQEAKKRKRKKAKQQKGNMAQQTAKEAAEEAATHGLFGWLNTKSSAQQTGTKTHPQHHQNHKSVPQKAKGSQGPPQNAKQAGQRMLAQQELVAKLRKKLTDLRSMAARQAGNAGVLKQVNEQIAEVQRRLSAAAATVQAGQKVASSQQDMKKLMKF